MAKKKSNGVKAAIRGLASDGITKTEFEQIAKQTGASSQDIVKKMDIMNKAGQDVRLNSGAANLLIKQAGKQSPTGYNAYLSMISGEPAYGTGNIGRTIQSMIGSPGFAGMPIKGQLTGVQPEVPSQLMIGGTQIRPGGRIAVRPMGAAPAVGDTTAAATTEAGTTTPTGGTAGTTAGGDAFDFQSMLDALTAMQQPSFDMSGLENMFQTQFDQLSSQFDQMSPLRLAQLGRAYGGDAIRARQNIRKTRQDYRRGIPSMALGQALANMAIGGGLTI